MESHSDKQIDPPPLSEEGNPFQSEDQLEASKSQIFP